MLRSVSMLAAALGATAAAAQTIQPGQWTSSTRMLVVSMPNTPPELLKSMTGKTTTSSVRVTAADVAGGAKSLFGATKGKCEYSEYRFSGGTIATKAQCLGGAAGAMTMTTTGTYTPTTYAIRSKMDSAGMKMTMESTSKRVGPCTK